MRFIVIHYCVKDKCNCLDRNGIVAYDGFDESDADFWMANAPSNYQAKLETI